MTRCSASPARLLPLLPLLWATSGAAQDRPEVATVQPAKPGVVKDALCTDVDGDGRLDLVLACHDEQTGRRTLHTHLRRAAGPAFANEPSTPPYDLERDVIAFAFADVHASPGRELVLFTAERAVAVLPAADGTLGLLPLFSHRLVWPAPDPVDALPLGAAVRDLDGDGLDDFALPEPDGARIVLQRRGAGQAEFGQAMVWTLPPKQSEVPNADRGGARIGRTELQLGLDLGDDAPDASDRGPLLRLRTRTPRLHFADFTGDRTQDAMAMRNDQLWWWQQARAGEFAATPTALPLPLPKDRLPLFDPAFDVQLADLDGDGRADLLLTTSARRDDEVEVRVDVFLQLANGGPWAAKPDQRLRVQTLARRPQLVDADGDGRLDLAVTTVRTDLLRGLTGGGKEALDAQLNVYRGDGKRFALPALTTHQLQLPARGGSRGPFLHVLPRTGGSPGEVVLLDGKDLALRALRAEDGRLALAPPSWRVPVPDTALPRLAAPGIAEVLVLDRHEVLHVRWR